MSVYTRTRLLYVFSADPEFIVPCKHTQKFKIAEPLTPVSPRDLASSGNDVKWGSQTGDRKEKKAPSSFDKPPQAARFHGGAAKDKVSDTYQDAKPPH